MLTASVIATIIAIIGSLNWLLIGIFGFNLVAAIFGAASIATTVIYIIVGIAGLWLAFYLIYRACAMDDFTGGSNRTESDANGYHSRRSTRDTL